MPALGWGTGRGRRWLGRGRAGWGVLSRRWRGCCKEREQEDVLGRAMKVWKMHLEKLYFGPEAFGRPSYPLMMDT